MGLCINFDFLSFCIKMALIKMTEIPCPGESLTHLTLLLTEPARKCPGVTSREALLSLRALPARISSRGPAGRSTRGPEWMEPGDGRQEVSQKGSPFPSLICSFVHLCAYVFICSFVCSFIRSVAHPLVCSPAHSLTCSVPRFSRSSTHSFIR